ncbi:hypothetical protein [Ilyomonas limi]|nr:hypothetical protein [Ilyomonas limi]
MIQTRQTKNYLSYLEANNGTFGYSLNAYDVHTSHPMMATQIRYAR